VEAVTVRVPASPEYLQVVRLIAAGLASRLGFTLDDIEDLKIGVDELAVYVTGPHGRDGTLDVRFLVSGDTIEIRGAGIFARDEGVRTELTGLSRMILKMVADSASLEQPDGVPSFTLVKSRQGP